MENYSVETFEDVAPFVAQHLLPEIQEAVDRCVESFNLDDRFNDSWTFGTHLWRNIWNRLRYVAASEDCPFKIYGKGNEYKLKIGRYILRHHKINSESRVPSGAKAVKESARCQMSLLPLVSNYPLEKPPIDNIVIAIDANVENGLMEVFVGTLLPYTLDSKKYKWDKKLPVFLAEGHEPSSTKFVSVSDFGAFEHVPEEELSEPLVIKVTDRKQGEKEENYAEK